MRGNGSNTRGNDNNTRGSGRQTRGKMEFRFSVCPDAVLKFLELLLADSSAHREISDFADNVSSRSHFRIFGHGCARPQMPKWNVRQPASTAGIRLAEGVCSSTALAPRSQGRPPRQQCTRTVPLRQSEVEETSASVLRGVRLCLTGALAMLPRMEASRRLASEEDEESSWVSFGFFIMLMLCLGFAGGWVACQAVTRPQPKSTRDVGSQRWPSGEQLHMMTIETLRSVAADHGLPRSGTKEMLVDRLVLQFDRLEWRARRCG